MSIFANSKFTVEEDKVATTEVECEGKYSDMLSCIVFSLLLFKKDIGEKGANLATEI